MNLSSLINTPRTPMTLDEKRGFIKRKKLRMGVYVVARHRRTRGFVSLW